MTHSSSAPLNRVIEEANNSGTSPERLHEIYSDYTEPEISSALVSNPNTPPDVLLKLGKDFPRELLANPVFDLMLLENRNLLADMPGETLISLLRLPEIEKSYVTFALNHCRKPNILAAIISTQNQLWNDWRQDNLDVEIYLKRANLSGADLLGADLTGADLRLANLAGADLTDTNLSGADLENADLTGADLSGTNLTGANLEEAYLENADLTDTNLEKADLTRADLTGANLEGANLSGADLTDANLTDANLNATLRGANLEGANLEGADLTDADLTDANLTDANLTGADLDGAKLEGSNLENAKLDGTDLDGTDLEGTNLENADLEAANLEGTNLTGTDLTGTDLDGANLMIKGAKFDSTGNYRYLLWRCWDKSLPALGLIMLNPSTADANKDDPTIKKCIAIAQQHNYGSLWVGNLFAYRSPKPEILKSVAQPVGPQNDRFLLSLCRKADCIICAWGNDETLKSKTLPKRDQTVTNLLKSHNYQLYCFGKTKGGQPKHPNPRKPVDCETQLQPY